MKKTLFLFAFVAGIGASLQAQNPTARRLINEEQGEEIVEHIDFLYSHLTDPHVEIHHYLTTLQPNVKKEKVAEYYLTSFRQACMREVPEDIVRNAQIYLLMDEEEDLEEIYSATAKAAEAMGNSGLAETMLTNLRNYSIANDNWLEEEVSALEKEIVNIRRERKRMEREANWNEGIKGTWVAIDYEGGSLMMVDINFPSSKSGAELIYPDRKIKKSKDGGKLSSSKPYTRLGRSQSIRFDGCDRAISMQFASCEIKDRSWLEGVSKAGLEGTRDFRTATNTYIRTSDDDWKTQLAYTTAVDLTTGLLDAVFTAMTTSSRKEEFYSLSMTAVSSDVMRGEIYHNGTTIYSDGRVDNWANKTSRNIFVRWEEEDGVVFISDNGKPIIMGSIEEDSPILKDYKELKWHRSLFNPRNLLPNTFAIGISGWMLYKGIQMSIDHFCSRGLIMGMIGGVATLVFTCIGVFRIGDDAVKSAQEDYRYYNKKGIDRLKRKMWTDLSFAPTYDLDYNAIGASLNLSF